MARKHAEHSVAAWQFQDALLETYHYAPGRAEANEPHFHSEYQLCLSLDFPGVIAYRGVRHPVPQGSLSVLHPGEKHASADPYDREGATHYRLFYLPPRLFQQVSGVAPSEPFFPDPILLLEDLFRGFLRLHRALGASAPLLEQESLLQTLLSELTQRYAKGVRALPLRRPERGVIRRVQDYIQDNYDRNISLSELAALVELHPAYLNQMFRQAVGLPPHAYQTQIRVERAKRLIAIGTPLAQTARAVGFFDQSHFGKYFRRHVQVTPARYRAFKTSYTTQIPPRQNPLDAAV